METTITIASMLWPVMLLVWMGLIINTSFYKKLTSSIVNEKALLLITWMMWTVVWIYMATNHNVWTSAPEIIVSLIGWIMLVKSAFILATPNIFVHMAENIKYSKKILKVAWAVYIFAWIYLMNFAYWGM